MSERAEAIRVLSLFDSHAHIQDAAFDDDREALLQRAYDAGVREILLPASDLADSERILDLIKGTGACPGRRAALRRPLLLAAVGVHPQEADSWNEGTAESLRKLLRRPEVCACGEIGLDYHYENSPREQQRKVFRRQIELAYEAGRVLVLHDRDAHGDFLEILQEAAADGLLRPLPGVVHCYSGSAAFARELLHLGFYFGFDGPITYKNARQAPEVLRELPLDHLLLETDSPYLSPHPLRGRRNEPANLTHILRRAAEILGLEETAVAALTRRNARRLFALPADGGEA